MLAAVKAADHGYPLRGGLRVDQQEVSESPLKGTVWVDPSLLGALEIQVGDTLQLGRSSFRVAGRVTLDPDRGSNFVNFEPRILVPL